MSLGVGYGVDQVGRMVVVGLRVRDGQAKVKA